MDATQASYDCIVVGGGPAGLAAAAALARGGLAVAVASATPLAVDRAVLPPAPETRTAALFPSAIALLERLGAWSDMAPACAPLAGIRIVDATGRLLRAPEIVFMAAELALPNLGYNVPNAPLATSLAAAAARLGVVLLPDSRVNAVAIDTRGVRVELSGGRTACAPLVVAADGRHSRVREAAGIATKSWAYDQAALATRFRHSRPHRGLSTELHGADGPCTTVPLPGDQSSLVWMDRPDVVEGLVSSCDDAFTDKLSARLCGLLGSISDLGVRRSFALMGLTAERMGRNRVALAGEAAHALPPIGAQGLNLGLSDAAVLADVVVAARRAGADIGAPEVLDAYDRARSADVHRRVRAVDLLNRSVLTEYWPLGLARGAGLHVLAGVPALRRRLMQEGLFPPAPLPSLLRPLEPGERLADRPPVLLSG